LANWVPGDVLRILLISTEEMLRNQVGDALAGHAGEHRLYWVSEPDLALARAQDLTPQIILLDDEALGARALEIAALIPDASVILLASPDAMDLARQAVLAGARGFVEKPVNPDALLEAIRQVLSQSGPISEVHPEATIGQGSDARGFVPKPVNRLSLMGAMRQILGRRGPSPDAQPGATIGRVVVFCAPESGTGRTTLTINTSIAIQHVTGQPAVLVDADYAAPAVDVALNLRGSKDISELRPKILQLDQDLVASVLAKHESGLSVLLAPPPAEMMAPLSPPQVQQVLVWLKHMFPWVLVDLGLPLDEAAFAFLDSADLICMSVLPEMIGLRNIRVMFEQLVARGYPEDKIWLILNRQGLPGGLAQPVLEDWLGRAIRHAIPDDQELATDTVNRGVPFVLGHKRSAVAKASVGLAKQIVQAIPAGTEAPIPVAAVSAPPAAPSPPKRRIVPLKPVLVGVLAVLIVLAAALTVSSVRRGLLGRAASEPTSVAKVAAMVETGTPTPETDPTRTPTSASLAQEGGGASPAVVSGEGGQALPSPIVESSATPMEAPSTPTAVSSPAPSSTPTRTARPTATWTPTTMSTPTRTASPTATPTPALLLSTATQIPGPTAGGTGLARGKVARVAADGWLNTRDRAGATGSQIGRLLQGAIVTLVAGPAQADNYTWWQVDNGAGQVGWVAAGPAEDPWLVPYQEGRPAVRSKPSPSPVPAAPALIEPAAGSYVSGKVAFRWETNNPLPEGAAYEVVMWNSGEDPGTARGIAAPTLETSLTGDLDGAYDLGLIQQGETFWTVLIVQTDPYLRLSKPDEAGARMLTYQAPGGDGGNGGSTPEPPKP
jgi:pilus assembly protein CpaE